MNLIQCSNQSDRTERGTEQLPPAPAQSAPQHPCEKKSSNEEVSKMGDFVGPWKRREVNQLARER